MDVDRLQTIIDWMQRSPLRELEIADGTFRVRLARKGQDTIAPVAIDAVDAAPASASGHDVLAPSYGIVHMAQTPGAAPLAILGARVEPGQPLFVIEAMKVFTTIEAEHEGTIAAILVEDGTEVSAGQPLFRLD